MCSSPSSSRTTICSPVTRLDHAVDRRQHHLAGVARGALLHARADQRRRRLEQRHRLALHVRAHQGAVGVVVLQERDQRARHATSSASARRPCSRPARRARSGTARRAAPRRSSSVERAVVVHVHVRLGDDVAVLLVGRQVADLVGDVRPDVDPLARAACRSARPASSSIERAVGGDDLAVLGLQVAAQRSGRPAARACSRPARSTRRYGVSMKPYSLMRP